ncbi:MAG: flavodoxin family protein [Deinococcota bacterium]
MTTVSVVYHSGFGNTAKVAASVAQGAASVEGVITQSLELTDAQLDGGRWQDEQMLATLNASDAIVFGSPTYMGMVSGVFKCFADATAPLWMSMGWKNKLAGGFTTSSHPSGDKVMTLHYMATLAAQLRMLWIGPAEPASHLSGSDEGIDQWGFYIGVGALGNMNQGMNVPTEGDLKTAAKYGERIANAALRW